MPDAPEYTANPVLAAITSVDAIPELAYLSTSGSRNWIAANRALFVPFAVEEAVTVFSMSFKLGNSGGGNWDIGIYDFKGNRLVGSGSVVGGGAGAFMLQDLTDTLLTQGYYFMAMAGDASGGTIQASQPNNTFMATYGICEMATAFPLPSAVTFSKPSSNFMPMFSVHLKSVV